MDKFTNTTITDIQTRLSDGEARAVELAEKALQAAENEDMNAYVATYDNIREQAKAADKRRQEDESGPLSGIPVAVKDNLLFAGQPVTAGSDILEGYEASYTATAVKRLKEAGAVLVGRTNMDEFAMGSSTERSAYGPTKNPHHPDRVPGGSSGGSAAAVAAGLVPAALGSDTGGSVRQPAAFCGVVGLKPTYGAVSRYGLIAMGSSLDQIGPITNSVADARRIFSVISGPDEKDSTTIKEDTYADPEDSPQTIGVPEDLLEHEGVSDKIRDNFESSLDTLESAGYEVTDVSLDGLKQALQIYYIIMPAEVSSNLARYDGINFGHRSADDDLLAQYISTRQDGFGTEVKRRILLGTYVLSAGYYDAYYRTAVRARERVRQQLDKAFESVDAIATPTTPTPAFPLGDKTDDPLEMYAQDMFTVGANIAGIPALSVPSGKVESGGVRLPTGLQLQAARGHESVLFAVGEDFEQARPDG